MRAMRTFRGWSQERLAREVRARGYEVKREVLVELELGRKREASVDLVVALASALRVPVLTLLGLVPCRVCSGAPRVGLVCSECGAGRSR
jgi:transcriptional regulator with XRE-family HTH domain